MAAQTPHQLVDAWVQAIQKAAEKATPRVYSNSSSSNSNSNSAGSNGYQANGNQNEIGYGYLNNRFNGDRPNGGRSSNSRQGGRGGRQGGRASNGRGERGDNWNDANNNATDNNGSGDGPKDIERRLQAALKDLTSLEEALMRPNPIDENATGDDGQDDDDDEWLLEDLDQIPVSPPTRNFRQRSNQSSNNGRSARHNNIDDYDELLYADYATSAAPAEPVIGVVQSTLLNKRRLLIRLWTSRAEILAMCASASQHAHEWKQGAKWYSDALEQIVEAQEQADFEVARWWLRLEAQESMQGGYQTAVQEQQSLQEDAEIVQVALEYFSRERHNFVKAAHRQMEYLNNRLQPQWESRDQAKNRIGEEKWTNNPAPKNTYYRMRQQDEKQLRQLKDALQELAKSDPTQALQNAQTMQNQIHEQAYESATSMTAARRYNDTRPSVKDYKKRVSMQDYPDPTEFGWTFTGSWKMVEFFEKENVKLDWYFTTATVKTSMDHPAQGKTQMFRKKVSPAVYRRILENPRVHTDQGYQRRPH
jgi:hypothetical protein